MGSTGNKIQIEKILEYIDSKKGKEEAEKLIRKLGRDSQKRDRAQRLWEGKFKKQWIEKRRFNEWMDKMEIENGEDHINAEYGKGYQPSPTLRLARTFSLVKKLGKKLTEKKLINYSGGFPCEGWRYEGYFFIITHGQGVAYEVYNKNNKRIISLA